MLITISNIIILYLAFVNSMNMNIFHDVFKNFDYVNFRKFSPSTVNYIYKIIQLVSFWFQSGSIPKKVESSLKHQSRSVQTIFF